MYIVLAQLVFIVIKEDCFLFYFVIVLSIILFDFIVYIEYHFVEFYLASHKIFWGHNDFK